MSGIYNRTEVVSYMNFIAGRHSIYYITDNNIIKVKDFDIRLRNRYIRHVLC